MLCCSVDRSTLLYRRVSYITDLVGGGGQQMTSASDIEKSPNRLAQMLDQSLNEIAYAKLDQRAAKAFSTYIYINALHPSSAVLADVVSAPIPTMG